ncbi:MAG: acyltransferase family protein [Caldimonas sp.]
MTAPPLSGPGLSERSFFFDIVRGVSAQMVVVGHALNVCFPAFFMVDAGTGVLEARKGLFYAQNLGVLVFFCISGYLVTASVVRRSTQPGYGLRVYLVDRFARIFTPLVPLLLILFVAERAFLGDGTVLRYTVLHLDPATLALNLTMLFDHPLMSALSRVTGLSFLKGTVLGTASQLWTVVIEWWIYVTFGLLAFALLRRRPLRPLLFVALALAAVVPAYALVSGNGLIVAWIAGMLFRLARESLMRLRKDVLWTLCIGSGALLAGALTRNAFDFYAGTISLLFSVCLLTLYHAVDPGERMPRPLSLGGFFLGLSTISYSVYLVHLSILFWILAFAPQLTGKASTFVVLVLAANAAAVLFYFAFERHYVSVRRFLTRRIATSPHRGPARS